MSRGGRGGRFGGSTMPPMGLTFADLAMMNKDSSETFPTFKMTYLNTPTDQELKYVNASNEYYDRLRFSSYNYTDDSIIDKNKKEDKGERYSDKYLLSNDKKVPLSSLKTKMNPDFFPMEIWEGVKPPRYTRKMPKEKRKINWDDAEKVNEHVRYYFIKITTSLIIFQEEDQNEEVEEEEEIDEGEDDADYGENYFDNGEGDEDMVGGDDDVGDTYD